MKKLLYLSSAALFVGSFACAQSGPSVAGTGGSNSTGSGGANSGGAPSNGSGGANSGGAPGNGSGGANSGGAPGNGSGGANSGGAPGTSSGGSSGAGTGGRGTGGEGTATGGAGTGGRGTGGAATGGAGTGTGGAATGGATGTGGSAAPTAATLVPTFNNYFWVGTCTAGSATGTDCPLNQTINDSSCSNASAPYDTRGTVRKTTHTVGGTTGTKYTLNLRIRGITGGRCYSGGTAGGAISADVEGTSGNNGWYEGGTQVGDSLWNTYEIHVTPPVPGKPMAADGSNVYFLNAFPSSSMYCERHETFFMKYDASFPVLGGGTITTVLHDSNCKGQQNCGGVNSQASCASPRTFALTDLPVQPTMAQASAAGLSSTTQPFTQTLMNYHPQWMFITIPSVTSP